MARCSTQVRGGAPHASERFANWCVKQIFFLQSLVIQIQCTWHVIEMTVKENKSYADFQTIVRRAGSLRQGSTHAMMDQQLLSDPLGQSCRHWLPGLRGVGHANSSPLSLIISRTWMRTVQSSSVR